MERGGKGGREKKKETQLETAQAPALAYVAVTIKEFGGLFCFLPFFFFVFFFFFFFLVLFWFWFCFGFGFFCC